MGSGNIFYHFNLSSSKAGVFSTVILQLPALFPAQDSNYIKMSVFLHGNTTHRRFFHSGSCYNGHKGGARLFMTLSSPVFPPFR